RRVRPHLHAQALAGGAPTEWAIEGKMVRIERLEAPAALVAGEMLAIPLDLPARLGLAFFDMRHLQHARAQVQARLDGIRDPAALTAANHDAVDDHLDLMLAAMIDGGRFLDVVRA